MNSDICPPERGAFDLHKSKDHSLNPRSAAAVLCTVELLGMSLWFTASAITPQLQTAWELSADRANAARRSLNVITPWSKNAAATTANSTAPHPI